MRTKVFAAWMAGVALALPVAAAIVHTADDGSTFDVTGDTLTINVPSGVTQSSYDYVAGALNAGAIQHVVKTGAGILEARAAASYAGTWTVSGGVVLFGANNAFGALPTAPSEATSITIAKGACIRATAAGLTCLQNRLLYIAGTGTGTGDYKGAIVGPPSGELLVKNSRTVLTDDACTWFLGAGPTFSGGVLDLAGHSLSTAGSAWNNGHYQNSLVITNSNDGVPATFVVPASSASNFKTHFDVASWGGGSRNTLQMTGKGRLYFNNYCPSDWTLSANGAIRGGRSTTPQTARRSYYWGGSLLVNGTATIGNDDANNVVKEANCGYGLAFRGSVSGNSSAVLKMTMGSWVSFEGAENTFQGTFIMQGNGTNDLRTTAYFQKDAPFITGPEKTVSITDSDIWMDGETVRAISTLAIDKGRSTITGSAAGSTIAGIEVTGGATNVLDTPATIQTYTLTSGRLVVGGTVPQIKTLTVAAGMPIDLNGKTVAVDELVGLPVLSNGGTLQVKSWNLDVPPGAPLVRVESIDLAADAAVSVTCNGGAFSACARDILCFPAGVTPPDVSVFSASAIAGCAATFAYRVVEGGELDGCTMLSVVVAPANPIEDETITAADGSTFAACGQVLTITVPPAVTNTYDYSPLVASHFVTNIVKMGDGVMTAVSMADYTGDFTIREGYWLVDADGDLGCKNVGVVRIECDPSTKNGGALKMADNTASGALTYQTIYVAGNGPDGTGAIRGPYSVSGNYSTQLQYMTYILTDDAIWLNDGFPFRLTYSTLDVAGHTLTFRAKSEFSQAGYFTRSTITNSVPEQGGGVRTVSGTTPATGHYCKFQLDGPSTWLGGANNTFATDYRMYIGKTDGDWTCLFNGKQIWGANAAASTAVSDANYWSGSVSVTASTTVGNNENIRTGQWTQVSMPYPIAFNGPISGAADKTLTLNTAFHLFGDMTDFLGTVMLTGISASEQAKMNAFFRNGLWLHAGAHFSCGAGKTVTIDDADIWFDDAALSLPALRQTSGLCRITGGSVPRPVIASFEKAGAGDLYVESTVLVTGRLAVTAGSLVLATNAANLVAAQMPLFSNLVFSAGTTFDMANQALEVPQFGGMPAVVHGGALTVGTCWTLDAADAMAGGIDVASAAFAEGATIDLTSRTGLDVKQTYPLVRATGSIALPPSAGSLCGLKEMPLAHAVSGWHALLSADAKTLALTFVPNGTVIVLR